MPWVLYLQKLSYFVYELLDFIEVYGTACRVTVKLIYRRLHQRQQFVRNPHGFVAGLSVGFLTWLLCSRRNGNNRNRRKTQADIIELLYNNDYPQKPDGTLEDYEKIYTDVIDQAENFRKYYNV